MIACFQPPPPTKNVLMNSGLKRWRHWMKNSAFSPNCVARSFEKFVKNDPEVSASEFGGIVIFNELAPEALTLESSTGAAAPERMMPELSPNPPAISAGESKPTHFRTPGCAHRVVKFALLGGGVGEEGAEVAAPSPEPPPPPLQAATAKATSAQSEGFLMAVVRALIGAWWRAIQRLRPRPRGPQRMEILPPIPGILACRRAAAKRSS